MFDCNISLLWVLIHLEITLFSTISASWTSGVKTVHACQGEIAKIRCPFRRKIDVIDVFYGRSSATLCGRIMGGRLVSENASCPSAPHSVSRVFYQCENQRHCYVPASSRFFGEPCKHTHKYLQVFYRCHRTPMYKNKFTCENDLFELECPYKTRIKIMSATYGRTEYSRCARKPFISMTQCWAPRELTTKEVVKRCDDYNTCRFNVTTNDISKCCGDPCRNIDKVLDVYYDCAPFF